ncbi:MAG: DUF4907 domain-containing protein [Bacteroidetes bacterium]|nr:DUF4907 domain-containing protein [Bacteroidota bacterium]
MIIKTIAFSILGYSFSILLFSCNNNKDTTNQNLQEHNSVPTIENSTPPTPSFNSGNYEVKTFEVKDSTSEKSLGWGYDIFVDGHKTIHQPIIPGVSGNRPFSSELKAKKTGTFAIDKIKNTGGLPTITIKELDSLGVNK